MPPKRKKIGRPLGSKNKKPTKNAANKSRKIKIKTKKEKLSDSEKDYECNNCNKFFPTKDALAKHIAIESSRVFYTKVNNGT